MQNKRNDEWGLIIKKQLEQEQALNVLEKVQYKQQQENYKKQLDDLIQIKSQQKHLASQQKSQEIVNINYKALNESLDDQIKKQEKQDLYKKIVEENLKLQAFNSSLKDHQKNQVLEQEIKDNLLDKSKYLDLKSKMSQHKKSVEKEMRENLKFCVEKNLNKAKEYQAEKAKEILLAKFEAERLEQRESERRAQLAKIQDSQNKRLEVYSKNISPKLVQREADYSQWVCQSEEIKKYEEQRRAKELERLKEVNQKRVFDTLKKQTEEKEWKKNVFKVNERIKDEELYKRLEFSIRTDEDKNFRKKQEVFYYRQELLQQAEADRQRRQSEFKLSDRERVLNKSILDTDKPSLVLNANEILKPVEGYRRSSMSPSLKNTTLQLTSNYLAS